MSGPVDLVVARRWLARARTEPADGEPEGIECERAETALTVGVHLTQQGRRDEALPWLRAAAYTGHAEAVVWYGGALVDRPGEFRAAEYWLRRAANADSELGRVQLGRLLLFDGRQEESDAVLARAFAADPSLADQFVIDLLDRRADDVAADTMRRLADVGVVRAMVLLAMLEQRRGRDAEVQRWLERAHELHEDEATLILALRAEQRGDVAEQRRLLEQAAEGGHVGALVKLGHDRYEAGDRAGARAYFERAAAEGDTSALTALLALMGVERDGKQARPLLASLAERGELTTVRKSAGAFAANQDFDVAEYGYTLAADQGDKEAAVALGRLLLRRGDADGAVRRLGGPAVADLPDAGLLMGLAQEARGDLHAARTSYERAALAGDGRAAHNLGLMAFHHGDAAGTLRWYERAAVLGDPKSMYNLGVLHALLEPKRAQALLEEAARRGHPHAHQRLLEEFG